MGFPRYLSKFTSFDGSTISYTFPTRLYSLTMDQPLKTSQVAVAGASHVFDQLGEAAAPKGAGLASHNMIIMAATGPQLDTEHDTMRSKLYRAGLGWLHVVDEDGMNERRARARLLAMPATNWRIGDDSTLQVSLSWGFATGFADATAYDEDFLLNADPDTISIDNPGNASVYDAVITLKGTFTNPSFTNANGYAISTTRDGSNPNHWLEIRCGRPSVRFSTDAGVTWVGDYALVTLPANQQQLMVFEPGAQNLVITGANGATVNVTFDPPWE